MNTEKYNILYKAHEYKEQLKILIGARNILKDKNISTYYQPYNIIMNELNKLIYEFNKEYRKVWKELQKIKNEITIDDIIAMEY